VIDNRGLWIAAASAAVLGITLLVGPLLVGEAPSEAPVASTEATTGPPSLVPSTPLASPPPTALPTQLPSQRPQPPAPAWQPVATGFARDFTNPGTGHADWLARVSRWTSDYLASQYARTDPHRIPVATLTGITTITAGETTVDFRASYDTGPALNCRVEIGPTGWKVTRALPAGRS